MRKVLHLTDIIIESRIPTGILSLAHFKKIEENQMSMPWEEQDPDWWKGEVDEGQNNGPEKPIEGLEGRGEPVILDRQIWGIAKKVKVPSQDTEQATRLVYWATVVKLYREMGGRFEFRPTSD